MPKPKPTSSRFSEPAAALRTCASSSASKTPALREQILRYHALEADTRQLSLEENYLIGLAVLAALGRHDTATMFAKTLLHLGTPKAKLLETVARLTMWIGGLPAAEAAFRVQRAIAEYERDGLGSLALWLPEGGER